MLELVMAQLEQCQAEPLEGTGWKVWLR